MKRPAKPQTKISFVLEEVVTPEEAARFVQCAKDAGAKNATEHFLNLTLRLPEHAPKHAA